MRRNGIFKQILPQLLAMVSALPRSMPRLCTGIFCILTLKPCFFRRKRFTVYGLADAPRRWWNRLDKFLISLGIQPTRADRCTYVCYDGAFKNDDVSPGTKTPKQVSYYVDSPSGEMTRDESFDIANEVRKSFAVEERLFSLSHAEGKSLYQQQRYMQKKSEACAWTPVVDEELLKFLESVEHKAGWIPYQNGHAQVSFRAKAHRAPDPYYTSKQYFFRTSIVKRKGVWWLLEMNADMRKEKNLISLEGILGVKIAMPHLVAWPLKKREIKQQKPVRTLL